VGSKYPGIKPLKTVPEVVIDAMGALAKKRGGRVETIAVSERGNA
jgi:hypothetical protein